jgi:hypothetical protein
MLRQLHNRRASRKSKTFCESKSNPKPGKTSRPDYEANARSVGLAPSPTMEAPTYANFCEQILRLARKPRIVNPALRLGSIGVKFRPKFSIIGSDSDGKTVGRCIENEYQFEKWMNAER